VEEIGQTERHIRRLLKQVKAKGDKAIVHALRAGDRIASWTKRSSELRWRYSAGRSMRASASRPEPMDEELSPDQSGKNRSDGDCAAPIRGAKPIR
jgi:hypothetical protein